MICSNELPSSTRVYIQNQCWEGNLPQHGNNNIAIYSLKWMPNCVILKNNVKLVTKLKLNGYFSQASLVGLAGKLPSLVDKRGNLASIYGVFEI